MSLSSGVPPPDCAQKSWDLVLQEVTKSHITHLTQSAGRPRLERSLPVGFCTLRSGAWHHDVGSVLGYEGSRHGQEGLCTGSLQE